MQGSVGTRFAQAKAPSSGYAYSTDEASASIESEMILNYVESPLKKTPAFWVAPRPTLDRLVRRRERGVCVCVFVWLAWLEVFVIRGGSCGF